jgi:hypothetical protein
VLRTSTAWGVVDLAADAARAAALGATELRLYHAGPACEADLAAVREALAELRRPSP